MNIDQLERDVDEDGTVVSYQNVHTDYARCEGIGTVATPHGHYVTVIADYQDRFIETRILPETLEKSGWIRDPARPLPAYAPPSDDEG